MHAPTCISAAGITPWPAPAPACPALSAETVLCAEPGLSAKARIGELLLAKFARITELPAKMVGACLDG